MMRGRWVLLGGAALLAVAGPAAAQSGTPGVPTGAAAPVAQAQAPQPGQTTLGQALARAYESNPSITGARAELRATDENVPIARSGGLPRLDSTAGLNQRLASTGNDVLSPERNLQTGLTLAVPVFNGGLVRNSVRAAETRVLAGRAGLRGTESQLFTEVVGAYMDVIRDEAVVQLNQQNVRVLEVNLQATRDRFEVGDLTRTDVAQSDARLAIARGQLRGAEAGLIASRENYVRLVGEAPGSLAAPPELPNLPASPDAAVEVAIADNPNLTAARRLREASRLDVSVARARRLPQVSVGATGSYQNFLGTAFEAPGVNDRQSVFGVNGGLSLSLPLFQGGANAARIRQAQALESQSIERTTETERAIVANTRSAFSSWRSALAVIESAQIAVDANRLSLEGVRAENSVGNRTILDILNAEQELLNSQVTLVGARRDAYVAGFALLAAMGRAEAEDLTLQGGPLYDPNVNYARVRRAINDFTSDPTPTPVATPTTATPAQTSIVGPIRDPQLGRPVDSTPFDPAVTAPPPRR